MLKTLKGKDRRYSVVHLRTGMCDQDGATYSHRLIGIHGKTERRRQ